MVGQSAGSRRAGCDEAFIADVPDAELAPLVTDLGGHDLEAMLDAYGVSEGNWRDATKRSPHFAISETPAFVGRAVAALAQDPKVSRWNGKSLSSGELAKIYDFTDLDGSQPDAWRYVTEVQDAGKPADVTGYR